jgi:AAA domain
VAEIKYKLQRLSDFAVIPATEYLIEPYLPLGGQIVLAALPKKLKTYVALSFACCVATGHPWLGHPVRKARVLYIALESYHGVLRRKEAWRKRHGKTKKDLDNLVCITVPINFAETGAIYKALDDLAVQSFRPDFIVIDTWFKSTAGANVSDQAEMTKALYHLTTFQKALEEAAEFKDAVLPKVTVLIIAHTDKKGIDLFGSVAQFANCDVLYMLDRKDHALEVTLSCDGARDIEEPPDLIIGLEEVIIETAKGAEKNMAVTKAISLLESVMATKMGDIAPDHDLAVNVLTILGAAGYEQLLDGINAKRAAKLSKSLFTPIVKDLMKAGTFSYDRDATNTWTDAAGVPHKSKGLYQVAKSQVVGEEDGSEAEASSSSSSEFSSKEENSRTNELSKTELSSNSRSSKMVEETESRNDQNAVEENERPPPQQAAVDDDAVSREIADAGIKAAQVTQAHGKKRKG